MHPQHYTDDAWCMDGVMRDCIVRTVRLHVLGCCVKQL
jgi:hypothetical protein